MSIDEFVLIEGQRGGPIEINLSGRIILSYDPIESVLELDISPEDLKKVLNLISGSIPETGIDISLPLPPDHKIQEFKGVKKLISLEQDGRPVMTFDYLNDPRNNYNPPPLTDILFK
ncbi:hypothetical protein KY358_04495 [Candidatus Woesearchaeota archaeon]|nr:hypothetical protein [Candidatus Woesearchaeota archaeon]